MTAPWDLTEEQKAWLRRHHEDGLAILSVFEYAELAIKALRNDGLEARTESKRLRAWLVSILNFTGRGHIGDMCHAAVIEGKTLEEFYDPQGSGAARPANEASHLPAGDDSAAPEKPWGLDHPSYDEMGQ